MVLELMFQRVFQMAFARMLGLLLLTQCLLMRLMRLLLLKTFRWRTWMQTLRLMRMVMQCLNLLQWHLH